MTNDQKQQAFATLYQSESDPVFRYCFFRTSDRELALDLAQEAFLRVWDTLQKGKELTNVRAFLFTVARNLVIDWYRKKKSYSLESLFGDSEGEVVLPVDEEALPRMMVELEAGHVLSKLKQLPELYREVVLLRFVEGLPPKEIAEILDESVNVVSVRITRAMEKLRILAGYEKNKSTSHQTPPKARKTEKWYRFVVGDTGLYAKVEEACPKEDPRRSEKPDGSWIPRVEAEFRGALSFWKEGGVQKYVTTGLLSWHTSVVKEPVSVIVAKRTDGVLYEDEFQAICRGEEVAECERLELQEFLRRYRSGQ